MKMIYCEYLRVKLKLIRIKKKLIHIEAAVIDRIMEFNSKLIDKLENF